MVAFAQPAPTRQGERGTRQVAITFDDLPLASVLDRSTPALRTINAGILGSLRRNQVTAVGFVNEQGLETAEALDPMRLDLLADWLRAGHELGNHTYSHIDLHTTSVTAFQNDLLRGERYTRPLAVRFNSPYRYFRHPFLHTGRSGDVQATIAAFLSTHGYAVAPVTIDNYDYLFSAAWERANHTGDSVAARRIRHEYVAYMDTVVGFYERQSRLILGRLLPQVLLLHANPLNAATLDALLGMLRRRGYEFITLDVALGDSAYTSQDTYAGPAGITWLHRWALTARLPAATFTGEPEVPGWVRQQANRP